MLVNTSSPSTSVCFHHTIFTLTTPKIHVLLLLPLCSAAACCFSCFMNENQPLSNRRVCLPAAQLDALGAARQRRDYTAVILMMEGLTEWVFVCVLHRSARACLLSYKWREIIDSALRMVLLIRRAVTQYPPVLAAEARACVSRTTTQFVDNNRRSLVFLMRAETPT